MPFFYKFWKSETSGALSRPVIGTASFVSYTDHKYRVGLRYWHSFVPAEKCIQLRHAKIYLHYSILLCWNNKQTVGHNSVFLVIQYLIQHVSACTPIIRCHNNRIDLLKSSRCVIVNSVIPKTIQSYLYYKDKRFLQKACYMFRPINLPSGLFHY